MTRLEVAYRHWTTREIALVREHFPLGGIDACLLHVQRNRQSIYQKAHAMSLHTATRVREAWPKDAQIDQQIRRLHETPLLKGAIVEFAERIRRPRWWVSKRARELGLKTPRFSELPWTPAEIQLLHDTGHIGTRSARRRFLAAGFDRSECAIHVKRKREGVSITQARQDAGVFTACQLADLLGVDHKTPNRWIRMGELPATRRGTERTDAQGGDHYSVTANDLREFIITHPIRIELRKIPDSNRAWFIELLAGRAGLCVGAVA